MTAIHGDCCDVLPTLDSGSYDLIFTDPPYPGVKRKYGTLTPEAWADMMAVVMSEAQRLLTPTGSAVFVLQANSEKVGNVGLTSVGIEQNEERCHVARGTLTAKECER